MSNATNFKTVLYKAILCGKPTATLIEETAKMGAQGLETRLQDTTLAEAREFRSIAEANGIRFHSMMQGGKFNDLDVTIREKSLEEVTRAIQVLAAYGGDALLVVPARIPDIGPRPWEFKIEFDSATCMVTKVVEGDNAPYTEYIQEQNRATDLVFHYIDKLVPIAAREGITLCLENVWNNLWVQPELVKAILDHFDNRWIKSYFDMGNHIRYAPTERWLRTLGPNRIGKMHLKDFTIDQSLPQGGKFVPVGQGDSNWVALRNTIEELGINGWVTFEAEGGRFYTSEEEVRILELFVTGNLTRETANSIRNYSK